MTAALMVRTATLDIAVERHGPAEGPPVVVLHGFPHDAPAAFAAAVRMLSYQR